jgi:hypothetical protein
MKRISHHAGVAAVAAICVLGAYLCRSELLLQSAADMHEAPGAINQNVNSVNLPTNGIESLTKQVGEQLADANMVAFDVPSQVEGVASSVVTAGVTTSTLAGNLLQYSDSLEAQSVALQESGIDISLVEIAPSGYSATENANGTKTSVLVRFVVTRHLENLPDWEEEIFAESIYDNSSGKQIALEIHDFVWYRSHPAEAEIESSANLVPVSRAENKGLGDQSGIELVAITATQKSIAVAYANKWWNGRNLAFRDYYAADCTNFISQALYYGGWTVAGASGAPANKSSSSAWWYDSAPLIDTASYSWTEAQYWKLFATASGRVTAISLANARTGDVIQYDVGGNGMNHTTIVTFYDTVSKQPLLTYHSTDTHNIPLSAFIANVKSEAGSSSYKLYAWRT